MNPAQSLSRSVCQCRCSGADFSELNEQIMQLKTRKAELEELLIMSPELVLTKKMITDKLKQDFQYLQNGDTKRLVQSYIVQITVTPDDILIIGGVPLGHCGRRI